MGMHMLHLLIRLIQYRFNILNEFIRCRSSTLNLKLAISSTLKRAQFNALYKSLHSRFIKSEPVSNPIITSRSLSPQLLATTLACCALCALILHVQSPSYSNDTLNELREWARKQAQKRTNGGEPVAAAIYTAIIKSKVVNCNCDS